MTPPTHADLSTAERSDALVLAIDTCGPSGSAALGLLNAGSVEILGQTELAGRSYSATLVAAVSELLNRAGTAVARIHAIVAVNGPGSFTGVRVGLSAVKGLAEVSHTPVVAVSRLEVLSARGGVASSALDAHRHEVFLRLSEGGQPPRDFLCGADELGSIRPIPAQIAVCDVAAELLSAVWSAVEFVQTSAPTAADALRLCAPRIERGEFVDLALLDGHYLRRSDAEIFGEAVAAGLKRA
ncbi:MAG: tRNA (adenosine(37)-N6)-threonylcarbamoyltransferase complex dimerization subunit type 1 TsaB [Terracidiphilus sp.]